MPGNAFPLVHDVKQWARNFFATNNTFSSPDPLERAFETGAATWAVLFWIKTRTSHIETQVFRANCERVIPEPVSEERHYEPSLY